MTTMTELMESHKQVPVLQARIADLEAALETFCLWYTSTARRESSAGLEYAIKNARAVPAKKGTP